MKIKSDYTPQYKITRKTSPFDVLRNIGTFIMALAVLAMLTMIMLHVGLHYAIHH